MAIVEATVNYSNAPPPAIGLPLGSPLPFATGGTPSVDVTAAVAGNGPVGFALTTASGTALTVGSRESGASAPRLVVETGPYSETFRRPLGSRGVRPRFRYGVLLLGLGALGLVSPPAVAAPQPRHAEFGFSELVTDGARYAASQPEQGTLVVRDELRGTQRVFEVGDGCWVQAAHAGIFLVDCGDEPFLITPRSSILRTIPGRGSSYDPDAFEQMSAIGTRWVQGVTERSTRFYVNWHTGRRADLNESGTDPPRDLDSPGLRRLPRGWLGRSRSAVVRCTRRGVVVRRLGRAARTLGSCPGWPASVGAGLVTWGWGDTAHALVLRTGRRYRWRFDRTIGSSDFGFGVQHTARYVYFNVPQARRRPTTFDVRRVRLP